MTFAEKLTRLTADVNKSAFAKSAGLPATAISNYINRKYVPAADTALRISRALKVPLDWLVDDRCDWPPPAADTNLVTGLSDMDLMNEACRRLAVLCELFVGVLNKIEAIDWNSVAVDALAMPVDAPLPDRLENLLTSLHPLESEWSKLRMFDASHVLPMHLSRAPKVDEIRDRVDRLVKDDPAIRSLLQYVRLRYLSDAGRRHGDHAPNLEIDAHRHKLLEQFRRDLPPMKKTGKG